MLKVEIAFARKEFRDCCKALQQHPFALEVHASIENPH